MEGVWKVQVRCLEVRWNVSCGPLLVGVWRDSEGCLDSVWRASEMCLEGVRKVSGRCLEGVWKPQIGPVWPHLTLEDIRKCLNVV